MQREMSIAFVVPSSPVFGKRSPVLFNKVHIQATYNPDVRCLAADSFVISSKKIPSLCSGSRSFSGSRVFIPAAQSWSTKLPGAEIIISQAAEALSETKSPAATSAPAVKAKKPRAYHWDGLKGLCTLLVVFCHFMFMMFPGGVGFANAESLSLLSTTPLRFLQEGQWALCMFFLLSGYLVPMRFFATKDPYNLTSSFFARYFRLALPLVPAAVICWFLTSTGLIGLANLAAARSGSWWISDMLAKAPQSATFLGTLYDTLVKCMFNPFEFVLFNGPLWMMNWLLIGSYIGMAVAIISKSVPRGWLVYPLSLLYCFLPSNITACRFYIPLISGVLLSDIETTMKKKAEDEKTSLFTLPNAVALGFVALSLYLGSYPRFNPFTVKPNPKKPDFLSVIPMTWWSVIHALGSKLVRPDKVYILWHSISSIILCGTVAFSPSLQKFLSWKPFVDCGLQCFAIMMLHIPIMFTVMSWLVGVPLAGVSYPIAATLAGLITTPIMAASCWAYWKYAEDYMGKLGGLINDKIFGSPLAKKKSS